MLNSTRRHLVVLDGHKSHVNLDVIMKAKQHGVDLLTLPSYISHDMQPLDVACFRPFKQTFRTHSNIWSMTNPRGKCKKEDLAQWIFLSLKKAFTSSNNKVGFRKCGIQPLNSQAMTKKTRPSKTFKPMDVEVGEYMEEILENGGLPTENNSCHYYVEHENNDEGPDMSVAAQSTPHYIHLRQVLLQPTKRRKVSLEPIIDYTQSQVLTANEYVEALEDIAKKKFRVAQKKEEKIRQRELAKRETKRER